MTQVVDTISRGKLRNPIFAGLPYSILQCGVAVGTAPTGTMAANGAVTFGTALGTTYDSGLWLYFASGAVYAGSTAGFYWTVMSSTTVGTVYNTTYVPGSTSTDIPASPTAIVAAGPGAFTGVTSEITAISVTLPGGSLGNHGFVRTETLFVMTNSAGNKILQCKLNASSVSTSTRTTTTASRESNVISATGGAAKFMTNVGGVAFSDGTTTVANPTFVALNPAVDVPLNLTLQVATATDHCAVARFAAVIYPS